MYNHYNILLYDICKIQVLIMFFMCKASPIKISLFVPGLDCNKL